VAASDDVHVVLNACELRSGAAFRLGSRESSCSRFGVVAGNDINVAEAVAGFVMPYLGNRDDVLPVRPADLVAREEVVDYPTDFAAMRDDDLERIALRGEQLTRLPIDRWCADL
jgi:hypothetical protein